MGRCGAFFRDWLVFVVVVVVALYLHICNMAYDKNIATARRLTKHVHNYFQILIDVPDKAADTDRIGQRPIVDCYTIIM